MTNHEVRCPCGSVAECVEDDDGCFRGVCRNGHEVCEVPEGETPVVPQHCATCEE